MKAPSERTTRTPSRRAVVRGIGGLGVTGGLAVLGAAPSHAAYPLYQRGDSGQVVLGLQQYLGHRGYWCGTPDGTFGHLTQQAVWALQKQAGIEPDGIVGRLTLLALSRSPLPEARGGSGTRVEVDLAKQLLLLVRDGQTALVLNTSTGNGEPYDWYGRQLNAHTPVGDFEVFNTYSPGWQSGPLGDLYRPQYFRGGIAVHGSPSIPPFAASHGCCRVSVEAMDMLWSTGAMQVGTPVVVA